MQSVLHLTNFSASQIENWLQLHCLAHLRVRHPYGCRLLLLYQVGDLVVPVVGVQGQGGREHVAPQLLHLLALLQQLLAAQVSFPGGEGVVIVVGCAEGGVVQAKVQKEERPN